MVCSSFLPHPYCQRLNINMRRRVGEAHSTESGAGQKRAERLTLDISHLNVVTNPPPPQHQHHHHHQAVLVNKWVLNAQCVCVGVGMFASSVCV